MNFDSILNKAADFFINFAVASFAVAAFQNRLDAAVPGFASILFAIVLASLLRSQK